MFFWSKKRTHIARSHLLIAAPPKKRGGSISLSSILGASAFCVWRDWYQSQRVSARHHLLTSFNKSNSESLKASSDFHSDVNVLLSASKCIWVEKKLHAEIKQVSSSGWKNAYQLLYQQPSKHWNQCFGAANVAASLADSQSILTYYILYTARLQPPSKLVESICCCGLLTFHEK